MVSWVNFVYIGNGEMCQLKVAKYLIKHEADIAHHDRKGTTAFFYVWMTNHEDVVDYLLRQGVEIEETRNDGYTPLDIACVNGYLATVQ